MTIATIARGMDALVMRIGRVSAWLTLILVLLVAANVLARYFLHMSSIATQELEWHLLAVIAMLGSVYTLQQGEHVRVDIFYQRYGESVRRWFDLVVALLLVVPLGVWLAMLSWDYVLYAYNIAERSPEAGGLPYRFVLKAVIPLGFALIALQGVSMALSAVASLIGARSPVPVRAYAT
jgi:TRAP-type mannitol/chloroaromatic compound transport system permease small subunit